MTAADHFVEHHSKRKQVGTRIDLLAFDLFGSHVAGGSDDHAGHRVADRRLLVVDRRLQFRETEVEDLRNSVGLEKCVFGLEISMHDAARVRRRKTACDAESDADDFIESKRTGFQSLTKTLSLEALRHEVGNALMFADVIDGENV
jgi:hypothetical protein